MSDTEDEVEETSYDLEELEKQAAAGNKAYGELHKHADDWAKWETTIIGLAALRDMTFAKLGHRNMRSQAYRDEIHALMQKKKFAQYGLMRRQERSACYKLMDQIHEVSDWYNSLASEYKLEWKHPGTIVKNLPEHLQSPELGDHSEAKKKKPANPKKPAVTAETERLRALLIQVIKRLMKYEPDVAQGYMDQIMPPNTDMPSDSLEDVFQFPEEGDDDEQAA